MTRRDVERRDIAVAGAIAVASLLLMALPLDGLLKSLALVPLVLFLPGYALSAAMFPPATLARGERLVYSVALSVCAAALGGLIWQLAFGLGRTVWACMLAAITLAGCAVAYRRRATLSADRLKPSPFLPRLDVPTALTALIALVLAVVAVRTAIDGLRDERAAAHFTALWVAPQADGSDGVEIGITNHQGAVHEYSVVVDGAGKTIRKWQGRLGSREDKRVILEPALIPSGARLIVSLYRDGVLYRRTKLQTEIGT